MIMQPNNGTDLPKSTTQWPGWKMLALTGVRGAVEQVILAVLKTNGGSITATSPYGKIAVTVLARP